MKKYTRAEIEQYLTPAGGYLAKDLKAMGVNWPPKKGWKQRLLEGKDPNTVETPTERYRDSIVNKRIPKYCPKCGGINLLVRLPWFARQLDDPNIHNTTDIIEYECVDCSTSFWMQTP